jgi:hypothetical protein
MFNRGISEDFVEALKGWNHWEEIINDPDLFVAIRDEYINIYFQGCSLFKISYKEQLVLETHYKYLVRPIANHPYVAWVGDSPAIGDLIDEVFVNVFDVEVLKRSSSSFAQPEKTGLHKILKCNGNVIDVEVALSPEPEGDAYTADASIEGRRAADRIDFAAIQKRDGKPCIVFFEAKRFENKELRSETHEPRVIEQAKRYKDFIDKHLLDFRRSYGRVCKNLLDLGLPRVDPLVVEAAGNPEHPQVDSDIRLLVFDFDQDQRDGKKWNEHKKPLEKYFEDRLLLKGSPSEFTAGIGKY